MEFNINNSVNTATTYASYEPKAAVTTTQSSNASSDRSSSVNTEAISNKADNESKTGNENKTGNTAAVADFSKEAQAHKLKGEDNSKSRRDESETERLLERAIEEANKKLVGTHNEFEYSYHKKTNRVSLKIVNAETKEVVTEIPPKRALDAVAKMWELAGIVVDEKK